LSVSYQDKGEAAGLPPPSSQLLGVGFFDLVQRPSRRVTHT
jgi:hypothetical protein